MLQIIYCQEFSHSKIESSLQISGRKGNKICDFVGVSATKTSVYIIHQKQALITVTSQNSDLRVTLFIPGFFGRCSTGGGGGGFLSTPVNSFVFKVRHLKFCKELLWDQINILWQEKSVSN